MEVDDKKLYEAELYYIFERPNKATNFRNKFGSNSGILFKKNGWKKYYLNYSIIESSRDLWELDWPLVHVINGMTCYAITKKTDIGLQTIVCERSQDIQQCEMIEDNRKWQLKYHHYKALRGFNG